MRLIIASLYFADRVIIALVRLGMIVSAGLILIVAIVGAIDVVTTSTFRKPVPIVSEVSADALAVIVFMAIGYAQYRGEHVLVDIVVVHLPKAVRKVLGLTALLVGLAFLGTLALQAGDLVKESFAVRESAMALISYPVYPFKIAFLAGLLVASLEFLRQVVRMILTGSSGAQRLQQSL